MGWIAVDMVRDMDKLCEISASIEEQIQGAMLVRRMRTAKEVGCYGRGKGLKLRGGIIVGELLRRPKTARSSTSRTNSPTGSSKVNFFEK